MSKSRRAERATPSAVEVTALATIPRSDVTIVPDAGELTARLDRLELRVDAPQSVIYRVSLVLEGGEPLPRFVCTAEDLFDYERFTLAVFKATGFVFSVASVEAATGELEMRRAWRRELARIIATRTSPWKDEFAPEALEETASSEHLALLHNGDGLWISVPEGGTLKSMMNLIEREIIGYYLKKADGGVAAAARSLGVGRQQLQYRMSRLKLNRENP